jgi:ABC-type polysaccharide/polyol phosphate transport system ATPase subunit
MANIIALENVKVEFPIFNASTRSLKKNLLKSVTGGIIGKNSKDRQVVTALDGITFALERGDRLALIGHNGSGKTTLLRVLAEIYHPTSGSIVIDGKPTPMFDIGLGIDPEATGYENIIIRGLYLGLSRREIEEKVEAIAEFSELGDFLNMPVYTYSSGMNIRLAFAVSTSIKPEILLLDEWIGAGDANFARKAEERVSEIVRESSILVLASHNMQLLSEWCNKALWLEHGKVKAFGDFESVLAQHQELLK